MKLFIYVAMMILTLGITGIMNSAMKKRNFKVNTWLNVLITSALTVLLLLTEDTSMAILQGIAFFHVLLICLVAAIAGSVYAIFLPPAEDGGMTLQVQLI